MSITASQNRLQLSTFKLNALLGMAQAISAELKTEELIDRFRRILNDDLGIDRILLYKMEEGKWELLLNSNCPDKVVENINVERDLIPFNEITFVGVSDNPILLELDVIIPVIQNNQPVGYVLIGDTNEYEKGVSATIRHLNFVQTLSIIIFVAIENLRLFHKSLEQEAIRKELELASRMQSMLIPAPTDMPKIPGIKIASYYHPHFEVGGDYYDVIALSPNEIGFCIADVSGKGISAALLMSNFQANLRALFDNHINLKTLIKKLNERVLAAAKGEKFITLFIGRYNTSNRTLEYINAGHNPPFAYLHKSKKIFQLKSGCVGLGMIDDIPVINDGKVVFDEPGTLICYTDGLVETVDGDKVIYSTKIIEEILPSNQSVDKIIEKIAQERTSEKVFDDISLLGFEFL
ncbi:PP2C family protein-serine/threonine phosphatase [Tenuifilum thalassicum]|uniref:SpoIIE family protein phosphatase n=1 Tax=Tenuifilum thalassicum TaxID=2590900 RepID=A0A7D3XWX4_9BACT|nr:SpoIIE family protein phosphatase [Tenuifilum thalassicum]QKG81028.1 SpoIIE family protein phosphatase [Tenuifilum thalassicum]